jgi:hypothetical protein
LRILVRMRTEFSSSQSSCSPNRTAAPNSRAAVH